MNLTPREKRITRLMLHQGRMLHAVRFWNRDRFRILMYHDFPDSTPGLQEALRNQCAHMRRYYSLVTLNDIARHLREGASLPPNALAVTVDDGNRDFLQNAYPVFHEYKIPVILFLVSGFLDQHLWLWWDQVSYLVGKSNRSSFELAFAAGQPLLRCTLQTNEQRQQAIFAINETLKRVSSEERLRIVHQDLPKLLDVALPDEPPPEMEPLRWQEVRHLAENGVDFGAHTVTHPVLSQLQDPQELLREIDGSRRRLEEELGRPVMHFCYPYGLSEHVNEETVKMVERCQFHTAVLAEQGMNDRDAHPFELTRISVDPLMRDCYFQEILAGLHLPKQPAQHSHG